MAKRNGDTIGRIIRIAQALADQMGYELIDAAFEKENTGLYLRFYLDKEDGITLDDCEAYHRALQPSMEPFDYDFMEVCSPGADRPIKTPRDAERCLGQDIEVRLYRSREGQKVFTGRFIDYKDGDITILCGAEQLIFQKKEIAVARCVIDLEEAENAEFS